MRRRACRCDPLGSRWSTRRRWRLGGAPPGPGRVGDRDPGEDDGGGEGDQQWRRVDRRRRDGSEDEDSDHTVSGHPAEHRVLEDRPPGEEQRGPAEDDGDPRRLDVP
jgi:hypothetical protein